MPLRESYGNALALVFQCIAAMPLRESYGNALALVFQCIAAVPLRESYGNAKRWYSDAFRLSRLERVMGTL